MMSRIEADFEVRSAGLWLALDEARLVALGRVDAAEADARTADLQRIAVDDCGTADDLLAWSADVEEELAPDIDNCCYTNQCLQGQPL